MTILPDRALDAARAVLAAVVAGFATAGIALPARRYVAQGTPEEVPWDCEDGQVTVALAGLYAGQAGSALGAAQQVPTLHHPARQAMPTAVFEIQIVRCAPSSDDHGEPPAAATMDGAGVGHLRDAAVLFAAMQDAIRAGTLVAHRTAAMGQVESRGPSGGLAAVLVRVDVTL